MSNISRLSLTSGLLGLTGEIRVNRYFIGSVGVPGFYRVCSFKSRFAELCMSTPATCHRSYGKNHRKQQKALGKSAKSLEGTAVDRASTQSKTHPFINVLGFRVWGNFANLWLAPAFWIFL